MHKNGRKLLLVFNDLEVNALPDDKSKYTIIQLLNTFIDAIRDTDHRLIISSTEDFPFSLKKLLYQQLIVESSDFQKKKSVMKAVDRGAEQVEDLRGQSHSSRLDIQYSKLIEGRDSSRLKRYLYEKIGLKYNRFFPALNRKSNKKLDILNAEFLRRVLAPNQCYVMDYEGLFIKVDEGRYAFENVRWLYTTIYRLQFDEDFLGILRKYDPLLEKVFLHKIPFIKANKIAFMLYFVTNDIEVNNFVNFDFRDEIERLNLTYISYFNLVSRDQEQVKEAIEHAAQLGKNLPESSWE